MGEMYLENAEQTEQFGRQLFTQLSPGELVFLHGELGVGKTTLVRGLLRESGYQGTVKSPTYNLVEEYDFGGKKICHFDLYRLKDPEELEWLGMDDYINERYLCLIEWPEMGKGYLPAPDYQYFMSISGSGRKISYATKKS